MSGKLVALNKTMISPRIVLESVGKDIDSLKNLYVVGIDHDGEPVTWATGDLRELIFAAACLQELGRKYLNKEIIGE